MAARAAEPGLRAVVRLGGETFSYDAQGAEDLGAFSSPAGFTQRCLRAAAGRLPLTVHFRPDQGSDRLEVVFELGRVWDASAKNLGPYRVEIRRGDQTIASVDVPQHFWFGRWRWQSAPRPLAAGIATLRERGLIPPYARGREKFFARAPDSGPAERYRIMELAGVFPQMGATGERHDIGLVTEHQARYLCTEDPSALATLRAQAEAAGTLPWHIRDERTDGPVDLDRHATMSWYGDPNVAKPHIPFAKTGISIDSAHQPALAYIPYLLTGDPYHLEDLQFAANYNRGELPPAYRLSIPQPRSFAWSMRTLAQAAKVTPERVPRWLLPASYFRADLERTRTWFEKEYVNSPDPLRRIFRATDNLAYSRDESPQAPEGTWISPWQHEFLAASLGWIVLMGFEEWREAFLWQIGGTLARTAGRSGWHRAYPSPYRLLIKNEKSEGAVESWSEAWRISRTRAKWEERDDLAYEDPTYAIYTRGALAIAARAGVTEAAAPLTWITEQLHRKDAAVPYKWRLI
ncbi:MAG: hypothetical protein AB7E79_06135 [Rhodospirillaceae bacterium]